MRAVEYRIVELEVRLRFGFAQIKGRRPLVCTVLCCHFQEKGQPKQPIHQGCKPEHKL
jgi:hypothetical protein